MMMTAKAQNKEWQGAKSAKFTTSKMHLPPAEAPNGPHPLFNMGGRKHYEQKYDAEKDFKATRKTIKAPEHESEV